MLTQLDPARPDRIHDERRPPGVHSILEACYKLVNGIAETGIDGRDET
jgi:hypothetical protein